MKSIRKARRPGENAGVGSGRAKYGFVSLMILILLLGALIALNVGVYTLEKKGGWRLDWSFNSLTTHSAVTREVLNELDRDVQIYALYRRGEEDA